MKGYWFISMLLCWGIYSNAQAPNTQLTQAQKFYQQGDYVSAAATYRQLITAGYDDAALYFNLGNSYFKLKEKGKAALCYEKALLRNNGHAAALNNLTILRSQLVDQLDETTDPQWWEWFLNPQWVFSSNQWIQGGLIAWWLGILGLLIWRLGKDRTQRRIGFFGGVGLTLLAILLFLPGGVSYRNRYLKKTAIVLKTEIPLKRAPETASAVARKLHEGTKVYLDDELANWYKVHLYNGDSGWIATSGVGLIQ